MESGNSNKTTENNSLIPDETAAEPAVVAAPEPKPTPAPTPESTSTSTAPAQNDWKNYKPKTNQNEQANRPPRSRGGNAGVIVGVVIAILLAGGALAVSLVNMLAPKNVQPVSTVSPEGYYTGNSIEFEETSVANIVSKVTPAVVSIISEVRTTSYFGSGTSQASGTGMIVTSDGYIITNKHVIDGARSVQVITDAGDTYDNVEIVGTDPLNDVAYLKIKGASDLPTIPLGDSKTIAIGQPVLAIGNALGAYQNSVTQGIIGGTGRSIQAADSTGKNVENLTDMLQTDAAINPGNSGGPLVNAAGEVIGINTAVSTDAQGLGFAIPISAVKGMLNNIIDNGSAERAYLGLSYITITSEVAKEFELSVSQGAYVYSDNNRQSAVISGGPAAKAGIKDGDIVSKINGIQVGRAGSISTLIGEYKVGDVVPVTIIRDNKEIVINVTLEAYKD